MIKTLTVTTHDRPRLLERMLQTLAVCGPHKYRAFVRCEPGCEVAPRLVRRYLPRAQIHVNRKKLGVRENPYQALTDAFQAGSEYNLYLEEDIILSPDAIALADWYCEHPPAQQTLCLNLLRYQSDASRPDEVLVTATEFNALGLGITRAAWFAHFQRVWFEDPPGHKEIGWDWSVKRMLGDTPDLFTVQPALSRSNHTGRVGTYCRPAFHDATFGHLATSATPGPGNYRYVDL